MKRRVRITNTKLVKFRVLVNAWKYEDTLVRDVSAPIPTYCSYVGWVPYVQIVRLIVCKAT